MSMKEPGGLYLGRVSSNQVLLEECIWNWHRDLPLSQVATASQLICNQCLQYIVSHFLFFGIPSTGTSIASRKAEIKCVKNEAITFWRKHYFPVNTLGFRLFLAHIAASKIRGLVIYCVVYSTRLRWNWGHCANGKLYPGYSHISLLVVIPGMISG